MDATIRPSTADVGREFAARFPAIGTRPSADDFRRILGDGPVRRSECPWTPRTGPSAEDRALLRALLLGPLADRLDALATGLRLSPGDRRAVLDLAESVARACLRHPVAIGARLRRDDGRGMGICVGTKPAGFLEDWQRDLARRREADGDRFARSRLALDAPLVWTVDPESTRPGISQSPLSDWTVVPD